MRQLNPNAMDRKELESLRGGLVYCVRTYRALNPYLKGIHLTIDGWRPFQDVWGEKLRGRELLAAIAEGKLENTEEDEGPATVWAVPRLKKDLAALSQMTEPKVVPQRPMRGRQRATAWYLIGNASGDGFGSGLFARGTLQSGDWRVTHGKSHQTGGRPQTWCIEWKMASKAGSFFGWSCSFSLTT